MSDIKQSEVVDMWSGLPCVEGDSIKKIGRWSSFNKTFGSRKKRQIYIIYFT